MRTLLATFVVLGLMGCASSQFNKTCDISAAGQQQAMENISVVLRREFGVQADSYIKEDFAPQAIYGGKDYCTYLVRPWRPIVSELIWDGTVAFRIDKDNYEVLDWKQVDE